MCNEIWKDIEGYEGLYQVSNLGRVKNLERYVNSRSGKRKSKEKILKQSRNRYMYVVLSKNSKRNCFTVHRLVAKAFLPNPNNLPQIDHINTDKTDNRVENLRWVTHSENMKNPITYIYRCDNHYKSKPILQLTLDGVVVKQWQSMSEASRTLKISQGNIYLCCNGKRHKTGGYMWKYVS